MNKSSIKRGAQAGFTLIELIVVIVILGILAATALPKFADLGADARLAKMQAAVGAVQSASSMIHGTWLVKGSPAGDANNSTSVNSVVLADGAKIAFNHGYPDVGGDGFTDTANTAKDSGIVIAAGGLADYNLTATAATKSVLTVRPDDEASRNNCLFTYTEATATSAPVVNTAGLTLANCK
jgi:MSHA pilin protein MshA